MIRGKGVHSLTAKQIRALCSAARKCDFSMPCKAVGIVVKSGKVEFDGNRVRIVDGIIGDKGVG